MIKAYTGFIISNYRKLIVLYISLLIPCIMSGFKSSVVEASVIAFSLISVIYNSFDSYKDFAVFCICDGYISFISTAVIMLTLNITINFSIVTVLIKSLFLGTVLYLCFKKCTEKNKIKVISITVMLIFLSAIANSK